ncbi:hypothetical protein GO986_07030 [Deinococcus sp. HMF7620]|uniref:Uncharacterized protein n=1 Tax=Deinococcus arboris TaxID=2682977 RepID=A0A7C9LLE6_9DEIO|nr:hypothetical protein [Deinococcus arboris]MVN86517.1 hypothetical protein [Deinococcus arboris]
MTVPELHTLERIARYIAAGQAIRDGQLSEGRALLQKAYQDFPPASLTRLECSFLVKFEDDLVFAGQFLPDLRFTIVLVQMLGSYRQAA